MRITKRAVVFLLSIFMAMAFAGNTAMATNAPITFNTLEVGKSYQFAGNGTLLDPNNFTIDHEGNIYIFDSYEDLTFSPKRALKVYSPTGEYLYSIDLPTIYQCALYVSENSDHIFFAIEPEDTVLEYDSSGVLIDIIHEEDSDSQFYRENFCDFFYKEIKPYGKFRKLDEKHTYTIFLKDNAGRETIYFQQTIEKSVAEKAVLFVFGLVLLFVLAMLADGMIYKLRKKGKMTDAFLFSFVKRINNHFQEAMHSPKEKY